MPLEKKIVQEKNLGSCGTKFKINKQTKFKPCLVLNYYKNLSLLGKKLRNLELQMTCQNTQTRFSDKKISISLVKWLETAWPNLVKPKNN